MRVTGTLLMITAVLSVPGYAQRTTLSVTGFPVAFPSPTAAEFTAGSVISTTATTFTVDAVGGPTSQRTAIVSIRCQAPCPTLGGKTPATLRWRRADLAVWNPLTTTDVVIESRPMFRGQPLPDSNDPWSNTLYWQILLDWTTDPPGASTYDVIFTLTITVP